MKHTISPVNDSRLVSLWPSRLIVHLIRMLICPSGTGSERICAGFSILLLSLTAVGYNKRICRSWDVGCFKTANKRIIVSLR